MADHWPWEKHLFDIPDRYAPEFEEHNNRPHPPTPVPFVGGTTDGD